jgi:hypothetical protein
LIISLLDAEWSGSQVAAEVFLILGAEINKLYSAIIGFIIRCMADRKFLDPDDSSFDDHGTDLMWKRKFKFQESADVDFLKDHKTYSPGAYILGLGFSDRESMNIQYLPFDIYVEWKAREFPFFHVNHIKPLLKQTIGVE